MTVSVGKGSLQLLAKNGVALPNSTSIARGTLQLLAKNAPQQGQPRYIAKGSLQMLAKNRIGGYRIIGKASVQLLAKNLGLAHVVIGKGSLQMLASNPRSNATYIGKASFQMLARRSKQLVTPRALRSGYNETNFPWIAYPRTWNGGNGPCEFETAWMTAVDMSRSAGNEDRHAQRDRPFRALQAPMTALAESESFRAFADAARRGIEALPAPIYCDVARLEGDQTIDGGRVVLPVDTRYRRFFSGQRILAFPTTSEADYEAAFRAGLIPFSVCVIESVDNDRLVLSPLTPTAQTMLEGSLVYPMIDCDLELSHLVAARSGKIVNYNFLAMESAERNALPSTLERDGWLPKLHDDVDGRWVFPFFEENAVDGVCAISYRRPGSVEPISRGMQVKPAGKFSVPDIVLTPRTQTRERAWRYIRFFDMMRGRLGSFFYVSPMHSELLAVTNYGAAANEIHVARNGSYFSAREHWRWVAFEHTDAAAAARGRDFTIARIVQLNLDIGQSTWQVILGRNVDWNPEDVRSVRVAHFVRFASDTLSESWVTSELCNLSLAFEGLQDIDEAWPIRGFET